MKLLRPILIAGAALAAGLLSSCSNGPVRSAAGLATYRAYDRPAKKPSNPSAVRVKVSLAKQMAYVMEGNTPLMVMPVSTGAPGSPTPTGSFTIFNKEHKHRANTHGYAYSGNQVKKTMLSSKPSGWSFKGTPMPYWCEFKSNYGFHTGWLKHSPCTHGCIRMHENLAPKFYQLVKVGTQVNISYSQPEDSTLGKIDLPPDAGPLPDYGGDTYVSDAYFTLHKTPTFQ
ncbi:L,D-transpeptidase [Haloferula sp. BvORR071]|uniref:L,D-transpeptidase n=1 Tax=Haloferula sp. BvORR071 TaxID=1396141 RepID=UPI00055758BC|nr:L,D-transpeptidase [Haloferula sp. BvORR071]